MPSCGLAKAEWAHALVGGLSAWGAEYGAEASPGTVWSGGDKILENLRMKQK